MLKYLKLIRLPNLIIIVLTQYLMRESIVGSILGIYSYELQMSHFLFALMVFSTVCLAAAGYVINDYFDRRIDLINRPGEVIIGKKIDRRFAIILHTVLNVIGVGIGFYLAYVVKIYLLSLVYLSVAGLFWYYSTNYKRQFLIGNIIVALLTAMVPLQVVLFENVLLIKAYGGMIREITNIIFWWVAAFSFYAFITNLTREIIKDIEDFEGDNAFGRNSLPVILGLKTSKIIVILLLGITLSLLAYTYYFHVNDLFTLIYLIIAIGIPILILIFQVVKSQTKKDMRRASNLLKIIMFTGILYSLLVQYIIEKNTGF